MYTESFYKYVIIKYSSCVFAVFNRQKVFSYRKTHQDQCIIVFLK